MRINKLVTALFLLLIVNTTVFSQATTNSPYSKYGIGVVRTQAFAQGFGMGGVGVGLRTYKDINLQNPASYSAISVVTFDVGYTNNALTLDDGTETQYQNNSYLDHISLAFPVVKNVWGMSFGVLPYSNVGYKYDEVINDPVAGNISFYNEGSGGVNKAYLGNALAVKVDSTSNISLGVNANFLFGSISYDQRAIYGGLPNSFNLAKRKDISIADFGFDFGLQYQKTFTNSEDNIYKLTVGATYGLSADLDVKRTELIQSFAGNDEVIFEAELRDVIQYDVEVEDVIQLPSELGFGVSLEKDNKWLLAVDYKVSNWGAIESNDDIYTYQSNSSFAFGAQFIPKHDGSNYLQRVAYRIGSRYSNSYLTINEVDFSEYGITFGIGLPVRRAENSYPRLNLGFEYGNKGTTEAGLIQEKFFNMNVGVTINATWFRKRKYD